MTDRVKALTRELRGVAGDLDDTAGDVQTILDMLNRSRGAHWGRWGDDEFGEKFAGAQGYEKSDANLVAAVEAKVELLRAYAKGMRDGAGELDGMDTGNRDTFRT